MYPIQNIRQIRSKESCETCNILYDGVYGNYIVGDYDEGIEVIQKVDIVPMTPNDAVYAVLPGVVEEAKQNASEGNL